MGWTNPLPFALGGDPTDIEQVWRALRAAEGGERGPGPEDGLEDLPRQIIAERIACAERALERAFLQAFPGLATDTLDAWSAALLSDGAANDVVLRELLRLAWKARNGATTPHLALALLDISPKLTIQIEDADDTDTTIPGKYLAPLDNVPDFGTYSAAYKPNYASRDVLRVVYVLDFDGSGEIAIPSDIERAVTKLLRARLPSTMTWTLVQVIDPDAPVFLLDGGEHGESVLDATPMG